jgi:hypothetical protein
MPEQLDVFQLLKSAALKDQLGHGMLFVSPSLGAAGFVAGLEDFVAFLMCPRKQGAGACGRCESCLAFESARRDGGRGLHPDLFWIRLESRSGYSVDQIKQLRGSMGLARSLAAEKIVVIEDAEELGNGGGASANALLKILEEPRPHTRLILTSARPEGVLPTIRSRCQLFRIPLPAGENASSALSPEAMDSWGELWSWIDKGLPKRDWPHLQLPADEDAFFKERDAAVEELQGVFSEAWVRSRPVLGRLDPQSSHASLHWFENFEKMLLSLRFHGQGALQWSAFKSRARVGS